MRGGFVCKNIIGRQGHIDVTGVFVDVQMDIRRKLFGFRIKNGDEACCGVGRYVRKAPQHGDASTNNPTAVRERQS